MAHIQMALFRLEVRNKMSISGIEWNPDDPIDETVWDDNTDPDDDPIEHYDEAAIERTIAETEGNGDAVLPQQLETEREKAGPLSAEDSKHSPEGAV